METAKEYLETASEILARHELKRTQTRQEVLSVYLEKEVALSHNEVEQALEGERDRVTIYRTLNILEEKGIIHKVPGLDEVAKYALCSEDCDEHAHQDEHIHFHCRKCGNIFCFYDIPVPSVVLPGKFKVESRQLCVEGVCGNCK